MAYVAPAVTDMGDEKDTGTRAWPDVTADRSAPASVRETRDVPTGSPLTASKIAMVGFVAVLLIEAISGDTFLHWAGLVP